MNKLVLWYPAKPYIITQKWGIYNPAYEQFGFSKHNGEDFLPGSDNLVHAPQVCEVVETGFNSGAGNFVRVVTKDKWNIGGVDCYAGIMFMHFEKILCVKGQTLQIGDPVGVPDNTGFSTGTHTHASFYRLSSPENIPENRLDTDTATNKTFDPTPYFNRYFAQDSGRIIQIMNALIKLYTQLLHR